MSRSPGARDEVATPVDWRQRARAAWLTAVLCCVCIVVFVATLGTCAWSSGAPGAVLTESFLGLARCKTTLEGFGALSLARVWIDGEWWRVITTGLLHGGWLHLILNVWSLWSVGEWAERAWGAGRTGGLFALGCIGGALASMAWAEAPMVVGASAGVLAIAAALLIGRLFGPVETQARLEPVSPFALSFTLVVMFAVGWVVPVIAQAGHVGGFAAGLAAAWAGMQRGWMRGAVAVVFALGGNELVHIAAWPEARPRFYEIVGYRQLDRGDVDAAADAFARALERNGEDPETLNAAAYGFALAGRRLDEADTWADAALQLEPENPSYLDTKGWIACRRGDVDTGLAWIEKAREAGGDGSWEIEDHARDCATADVSRETLP